MQKILVIDDSKELLEMIEFILQHNGHHVKTATTKKTALEQVVQFQPTVILMDVRLNNDDGRALCKEIKSDMLSKPVFIFLLSASPELLLDYRSCCADGVIEKPFDIDTIINKIAAITIDAAKAENNH